MNIFYAKDRKAWREWLIANHDKESEIWLIKYHKGSATPSVPSVSYYVGHFNATLGFHINSMYDTYSDRNIGIPGLIFPANPS